MECNKLSVLQSGSNGKELQDAVVAGRRSVRWEKRKEDRKVEVEALARARCWLVQVGPSSPPSPTKAKDTRLRGTARVQHLPPPPPWPHQLRPYSC